MILQGDLAQLIQALGLAVAVGCGTPAIIYLAARGRREKPEAKLESEGNLFKPQPASAPQTAFNMAEREQLVPVVVYVSKSLLEKPTTPTEQSTRKEREPEPVEAKRLIWREGEKP
jgi:hypothetical protein